MVWVTICSPSQFFLYQPRNKRFWKQIETQQVKLVTTKLGGQLEPFADVSKGYRLAKPLGWNRYDGTSGEYTVKMVDLVDPTTLILLTNSPVKSDTEVCGQSVFGGGGAVQIFHVMIMDDRSRYIIDSPVSEHSRNRAPAPRSGEEVGTRSA